MVEVERLGFLPPKRISPLLSAIVNYPSLAEGACPCPRPQFPEGLRRQQTELPGSLTETPLPQGYTSKKS
ncbi:MAG: hypothetical protein KKF66_07220, partial [Actinobacteria bacterium]|nr:hypothetical protein [Actinomycetota bacterium]